MDRKRLMEILSGEFVTAKDFAAILSDAPHDGFMEVAQADAFPVASDSRYRTTDVVRCLERMGVDVGGGQKGAKAHI